MSGSPNRRSRAASLPYAFASNRRARSRWSRLGKDPALAERLVQHGAANFAPLLNVLGRNNNHVRRDPQRAQHPTKAHHFVESTFDIRLDHEEVEIAVWA